MALLFISETDRLDLWRKYLLAEIPDLDMRLLPEIGNKEDIEYALVWRPPAGLLKTLPNLKVIFSLGAGIDHLASDPDLPENVPVVRMVDSSLTSGMTEYVVMSVLNHHKNMRLYREQQSRKEWTLHEPPVTWDRRVGIMGMGVLGSDVAGKLSYLGFDVAGWSRTHRERPGIKTYAGTDQLEDFLKTTEILVCLLPLTDETEDILNKDLFAMLPKEASIINAARGGHLVEEDLIEALDSEHLSEATLDVFKSEPLDQHHPFWEHPKITITPHAASTTHPSSSARNVADGIKRFESGDDLLNIVDMKRGY
ncbi:hydroxyacid dehydrogenase [Kiloniella spongiae]|uniref:Hydroxyacid dehydrogenase n=1 Tax=Kiloniella spongiae TaxID=1489064 RepID=A0A0H2MNW7_9PROT|nr:glyoxylate/hydroxypyruvate reductase A [Kiloniella spongiae]KLN62432.1 hydroxyacid dehydrogenase [Kiloniella spongiae]